MERLPHPSGWQHVPIAPMRPFGVVELYDGGHQSPCFLQVMGTFHPIKPFLLDDAVHALRYGVVRGLVVLRHADGGIDRLQVFYIPVTAVLDTAVGMMDQPLKPQVRDILDPHVQGRHGIGGGEAVREDPSDDLMGEGVSEQVEIGDSHVRIDISDVGHPQLVGAHDGDPFRQIAVFAIVVIGIRRVATPRGLQHEAVLTHQPIEPVTPFHLPGIQLPEHQEQFIGPYSGSAAANVTHGGDDLRAGQLLTQALLLAYGIITFATLAKQPAQLPDGFTGMFEPKVVYCLAPAFFSRSMPYRSRPISRTSWRASLRSSEYDKALRRRRFSSRSRSSSVISAEGFLSMDFLRAIYTWFSNSLKSSGKDNDCDSNDLTQRRNVTPSTPYFLLTPYIELPLS